MHNTQQISHPEMVARLAKDGEQVLSQLTPPMAHLWHMATGVSGEAGELLDAIKKAAIYGNPLYMDNVIEELGDIEFYLEGIRMAIGVTRADVLQANIDKLAKRYPQFEYSNAAAIERADKK